MIWIIIENAIKVLAIIDYVNNHMYMHLFSRHKKNLYSPIVVLMVGLGVMAGLGVDTGLLTMVTVGKETPLVTTVNVGLLEPDRPIPEPIFPDTGEGEKKKNDSKKIS